MSNIYDYITVIIIIIIIIIIPNSNNTDSNILSSNKQTHIAVQQNMDATTVNSSSRYVAGFK
jgi:hypothetical protein